MAHASSLSLCTAAAIGSALVIGSAAAWAQEAAPALGAPAASVPAAPAAAPPQPMMQLPTQAPASPTTAQPVIQHSPQTDALTRTAATPDASAARRRSTAHRKPIHAVAAAPASAARSAAAVQPAPALQTVQPLPPAASVPLAQPAVPPAPPAGASRESIDAASDTGWMLSPGAAIAAILVALGLGGAAYALRSRRRGLHEGDDEDVYDTQAAQVYDEPDMVEPVSAMAVNEPTGGLEPEAPLPAVAATEQLVAATEASAEGKPLVMPAGPVPQERAARDALLEQMIAAPPNDENPFTSRKARLRRARIILQRLEYEQKEAATQPFDWRTYKPSTSHPAPATPPRVTV